MSDAEILSERVLVRLTSSDRDKLEKRAAAIDRTLSWYIRHLILRDLGKSNGHPAPDGQPGSGGTVPGSSKEE